MDIVKLIMENLDGIASFVMVMITLASIITAGTKTPPEGSRLSKAYQAIEYLALVNKRTKETGKVEKPTVGARDDIR